MTFFVRPKNEVEDINLWLQEQFEQFKQVQEQERKVQVWAFAPLSPEDGMLVIADGVGWNPGNGAGFYGYYNGNWRFLG